MFKNKGSLDNEGPKCPVCKLLMSIPIYQCKVGHSVCAVCTANLIPPLCPLCRQDMTQIRNWQLEQMVTEAKVPCPNKVKGCTIVVERGKLEEHLTQCIFRNMSCPLVEVGKCSWTGQLKTMFDHFMERHPTNILKLNIAATVNINLNEDERNVYIHSCEHRFFIVNMKINTFKKNAYWSVQHIGPHYTAKQYIYKIVVGPHENRNITFTDSCVNDATKADDIFQNGKCPTISFETLKHYLNESKLKFTFSVTKQFKEYNKNHKANNKDKPKGPKFSNDKSHKEHKPCPKGFPKGKSNESQNRLA